MFKKIVSGSILVLAFYFQSCSSAVNHEKCIDFYVQVREPVHRARRINYDYSRMAATIIYKVKENNLKSQDTLFLDSLLAINNLYMALVDSSISKIELLDEVDPQVKLKKKTLEYLKLFRPFFDKSIPFILKIYKNGMEKRDPVETRELKEAGERLKASSEELLILIAEFRERNNITLEEAEKHGLSEIVHYPSILKE